MTSGHQHPDRCHWRDCPQGTAHHPHDWRKEIEDDEPDWLAYISDESATKAGTLTCGVCHEQWPCSTKRSHLESRRSDA